MVLFFFVGEDQGEENLCFIFIFFVRREVYNLLYVLGIIVYDIDVKLV